MWEPSTGSPHYPVSVLEFISFKFTSDAKYCRDLIFAESTRAKLDTKGIFCVPHDQMPCVATIFARRKSIDSSWNGTRNLNRMKWARYL
ncbi:hypothetical protein TNCV_5116261 [Trichonephila clavipes]|nr:hypothetical protein TNCV_5116261 [Trichonephila clavipes]